MSDRRNPYTPQQIDQLREWAALSAKTTGNDPADSETRKAGDQFADLVAECRDALNPPATYPELAEPLGMKPDTVRGKLARRNKETPYPSMRQYENKPLPAAQRTEDHFSCYQIIDGEKVYCERTEGPDGNTYYKPGRNGKVVKYCRRHQLIRLHRGREARRQAQQKEDDAA